MGINGTIVLFRGKLSRVVKIRCVTTLNEGVALNNIGAYIVEHELLIGASLLRHYGTSTQYT